MANQANANGVTQDDIASIETELFSQTYSNESINNRLDKIEKMIYGKNFSHSNINERINNLSPFIPTNSVINTPPLPAKEDNTSSSSPLPKIKETELQIKYKDYLKGTLPPRQNTIFTEEPKNKTSYPNIDQAELLLLGQVFTGDDVYKRLNRLETEVNISKPATNLNDRMQNIEKQIRFLSLKQQYGNKRNIKKQPDINIMPEPINNHHYNKNFSNGVQAQYINPINYTNNAPNKYPANMPAGNMNNNSAYMHPANYQNNTVTQPNRYAGLVPYATQDLTQTATNALIDNTVAKKPGLWSKITKIGRMTKSAIFGSDTLEDFNYYPPVY